MSDRQEQISNLYRNVLGREPDVDGLAWWVSTTTPIEEIRREFIKAPEAIAVKALQVAKLFYDVLGREPDIEGFKYWVLSQTSVEDIRKSFIDSDEYKNKEKIVKTSTKVKKK